MSLYQIIDLNAITALNADLSLEEQKQGKAVIWKRQTVHGRRTVSKNGLVPWLVGFIVVFIFCYATKIPTWRFRNSNEVTMILISLVGTNWRLQSTEVGRTTHETRHMLYLAKGEPVEKIPFPNVCFLFFFSFLIFIFCFPICYSRGFISSHLLKDSTKK